MKKTLIALIVIVLMSFGSIALAGETAQSPVMMTDTQMDNVVAAGPAWGHDWDCWTSTLTYVPGNNNNATYYVGYVSSAKPCGSTADRNNFHANGDNARFF